MRNVEYVTNTQVAPHVVLRNLKEGEAVSGDFTVPCVRAGRINPYSVYSQIIDTINLFNDLTDACTDDYLYEAAAIIKVSMEKGDIATANLVAMHYTSVLTVVIQQYKDRNIFVADPWDDDVVYILATASVSVIEEAFVSLNCEMQFILHEGE